MSNHKNLPPKFWVPVAVLDLGLGLYALFNRSSIQGGLLILGFIAIGLSYWVRSLPHSSPIRRWGIRNDRVVSYFLSLAVMAIYIYLGGQIVLMLSPRIGSVAALALFYAPIAIYLVYQSSRYKKLEAGGSIPKGNGEPSK